MHSTAWNALGAYQLSKFPWKPKLSYRYAFFEGPNPNKAESQAFDPLYIGFYDWGTWWQGEIAGEYFLSNSNNISQPGPPSHVTDRKAWMGSHGLLVLQ